MRGAAPVAKLFEGRAAAAQLALIDGETGLVFTREGQLRAICECVVENGRIVEMEVTANPATLDELPKAGLISR